MSKKNINCIDWGSFFTFSTERYKQVRSNTLGWCRCWERHSRPPLGGNGAGSASELKKNTALPLQVHSILQIYSDKEVTLALFVTVYNWKRPRCPPAHTG